jgi:hypothetical protein
MRALRTAWQLSARWSPTAPAACRGSGGAEVLPPGAKPIPQD